jgi:hypothetical protein
MIENRIANTTEFIDKSIYINGLVYICNYMLKDLEVFLEKEGRKFGIMLKYLEKIDKAMVHIPFPTPDLEIYQKITYLYKPLLTKQFKTLKKKRVTEADSVIVMLYNLTKFILNSDNCEEYRYMKYVKKVNSVIELMFVNIKNKGKLINLYSLFTNTITGLMNNSKIGKLKLTKFTLTEEEERLKNKTPIIGDGELVSINNEKLEICL